MGRTEAGFKCASSVVWRNWEPGKEYYKVLPIKNVSRFVQILHWHPPDCPDFATEYQGPVRLNPGVTSVIGLVFKPSKLVEYHSKLQFAAAKGSFSITLRGIASKGHVECQDDLSFGGCVVKETAQKHFQFANTGDEATPYEWIVQPPFSISPKAGFLQPGESVSATCYFMPENACSYSAQAFCLATEDATTCMNLSGIGKFTFLHISPSVLDFGDVVVGSAQQMVFGIVNTSEVVSRIHIEVIEDCTQPFSAVFTVDLVEFLIQPNEHLPVKDMLFGLWSVSQQGL